jgi:hypothetical protein
MMLPGAYTAEVITLNRRVVIKVTDPYGYHVGYFDTPEEINHLGRPIDLASLRIKTRPTLTEESRS